MKFKHQNTEILPVRCDLVWPGQFETIEVAAKKIAEAEPISTEKISDVKDAVGSVS